MTAAEKKKAKLKMLLEEFENAVRVHQEEMRGPDPDYALFAKKEVERWRKRILAL